MITIKSVNLETVVGVTTKELPRHTWPEFAFAGKSNVGKSTLINALMNRKSYARVSAKPGKTQTINYYNINDRFYLVDLPGYGFTSVARADIKAQWGRMIENYLHTSPSLKEVFLLVDIRHEPGDNDVQMYDWILHYGFEPVLIATKADKLKRSQLPAALKVIEAAFRERSLEHAEGEMTIIPFSGVTKAGRDQILTRMEGQLQ